MAVSASEGSIRKKLLRKLLAWTDDPESAVGQSQSRVSFVRFPQQGRLDKIYRSTDPYELNAVAPKVLPEERSMGEERGRQARFPPQEDLSVDVPAAYSH